MLGQLGLTAHNDSMQLFRFLRQLGLATYRDSLTWPCPGQLGVVSQSQSGSMARCVWCAV
jgi:hypothetical protein